MAEELDELVVRVRADTRAVRQELDAVRREVNGPLAEGLDLLGGRIEGALLRGIRQGKLGFEDLQRSAMSAMNSIAAASLRALLPGGRIGGLNLGSLLGGLVGLPGRQTGGAVMDNRPYLVGERGPELFVPGSAGRVEPMARASGAVNVSVSLRAPPSEREAAILSRSSRQLAAAVRRAVR
ncbi:tail tape measure protein [Sphingomicrobium sp. XHP0239]|uniref:tail tape measure protein n=1 Tax=Sphingomicrobium maritimum TaxID=3133972 RepID=UPI0031CC3E56